KLPGRPWGRTLHRPPGGANRLGSASGLGVESRLMSFEAPAPASTAPSWTGRRPTIPPVGEFLNAVRTLGFASFRVAFPALAFEYFFYLGAKLYLELTVEPGAIQDP